MKRRVLITVSDGLHYRYLVQSGILDKVVGNSSRVVVYSPPSIIEKLRERAWPDFVSFIASDRAELTLGKRIHLFLRSCQNLKLSTTVNIKAEQQRHDAPLRHALRKCLTHVFAMLPFDVSGIFERSWRQPEILEVMQQAKIDLVIVSTPGQKLDDIPFLRAAKEAKIESVSPVYSWDNLTAKGPFAINPTKLVVWNSIMQDEAIDFHGYKQENVFIGGVPVFDPYFDVRAGKSEQGRQTFCKKLGLSSSRKLITITTIPRIYYGDGHIDIVKHVLNWVEEGALQDSSILLRPHPMDETDYSILVDKGVVVDNYGSKPNTDPRKWMPAENNRTHLAETMMYSDVVVNIASTISVDAACFDTPVINVAFDSPGAGSTYVGPVDRYYKYTHYSKVTETGAVQVVFSPEEFLTALRNYFEDPLLNQEQRKQLLLGQVGELNGNAYAKTAELLFA